mmetsp:Transcript_51816/g.152702  ORF Transcript_51816/g.152702 Transcript_51816/m.152702 type:complete len:416 (-) Transcript_51816:20-1267(-)
MAPAPSRPRRLRSSLLGLAACAAASWPTAFLAGSGPARLQGRLGPGSAAERAQVQRRAAVAGAPEGEEEGVAGIGRRLATGSALTLLGGLAVKRFGVDGNMDVLPLAPGSLKGRTIVITGGNTGLGRESALRLAKAGATIVLTARTDAKGQEAVAAIKQESANSDVHYLQLDLADLASVNRFSEAYKKQPYGDRIDVLMNNAGVMAIPERQTTKDGFEQQLGVNHLGHFALTGLLMPLLKKAKGTARVVNLSSTAHLGATKELLEGDLMAPERYTQWGAYCQSKLANVLFSQELDRRFKAAGVNATAVSCHPGGVDTDLARWLVVAKDDPAEAKRLRDENFLARNLSAFLTRDVHLGANTQIYLAAGLDGGLDKSGGKYFDNMGLGLLNPVANDQALAARLWDESERLTGVKVSV